MKTAASLHDIASALSAIAESVHIRTLRLVEAEELAVGEIAQILQLPQSTVSRRLKILADHGWVQKRAVGTATLYRCVSDDLPEELRGVWAQIRESSKTSEEIEADQRRLRTVVADRKPGSAAFFGRVGAAWDDMSRDLFGERYVGEALASLLPPGLVVADIGCGTGAFTAMLAPMARKIHAIDREPTMLDAARARLGDRQNIEFLQGQAEKLPLIDGCVDLVVLGLILHHLEEPSLALHEAARVLAPQGRVLIVDMQPHGREAFRLEMGHRWLGFSKPQLSEFCERGGLVLTGHRPLPGSPEAKGPEVFAAIAQRPTKPMT
ncbi:MAG: methyltransferase domain-containing protein [Phycisphaeraceae bacterium]|nr:methyltransferase domain-containing protein [Phycisphaeraceae bacterium]